MLFLRSFSFYLRAELAVLPRWIYLSDGIRDVSYAPRVWTREDVGAPPWARPRVQGLAVERVELEREVRARGGLRLLLDVSPEGVLLPLP